MNFPGIINYLLTLRYPGSESGRQNWVCYRGGHQTIVPVFPPNTTVKYTVLPLHGVYAWLAWSSRFGDDMVPNTFTGSINFYGTEPLSAMLTSRVRNDPFEYFTLITEQEPMNITMSNISPLGQRAEILSDFLVIPTPNDLSTITDALRRLETSRESEQLLQQAVILLGKLAKEEVKPLPAIGEIE